MSLLSIPSPNTNRELLSLAELRSAAGVADNSRDAELTALGGYVSAMITKACRVTAVAEIPPTLRLESVVETFGHHHLYHHHHHHHHHHQFEQSLILARRPIVEITSVTEGGSALTTNDYELEGRFLYRIGGQRRSHWRGPVVVSWSAGYATVPLDLKYAAIKFVQAQIQQGDRDPMLKRKVTQGVSEYEWWVDPTKDSIVPPEVYDILDRGDYINKASWMR